MDCIPPSGTPRGSRAPMENSPPGIQTMPCGASLGAGTELATVGKNVASAAGNDGPAVAGRERVNANAPSTTATTISAAAAAKPHRARRLLLRSALFGFRAGMLDSPGT